MGETSKENKIPTHIGFIMDGNRRWARANKLETIKGHHAGSVALENIIEECGKAGISYLTFFSFSTENWKRSKEEVEQLLALFLEKIKEKEGRLAEMGAKVQFIGRTKDFSRELRDSMSELEKKTSSNSEITINFAVSYGGKAEIVDAVNAVLEKKEAGENITEQDIEEHIYEAGLPDPDLIMRTGGESRLSGFMLWQSTYAELYFAPTLWPDFDGVELEKALSWYSDVKRNFGK